MKIKLYLNKNILLSSLFILIYSSSFSQAKVQLEDWKFLSFGALVGYQFQKSSLVEFGAIADLEYKFLFLSTSFSIENDFGRKVLGLKGSLKAGAGIRACYVFGGIDYLSLKSNSLNLKDEIAKLEAGVHIPVVFLLKSPYKHLRFNLKISYCHNFFLDTHEIESIGKHGLNVSLMFGYGFHVKPKNK